MIPIHARSQGPEQRRLLELFGELNAGKRQTLLAFAEFLVAREDYAPKAAPAGPEDPMPIPRPEAESVVAAIRRLSASYFMLERRDMLNETAALMSAHVLQGRPAPKVVEELEALFEARYQQYRETYRG